MLIFEAPPSTRVSDQTIFFIPSAGFTHGPPLSLHPGEPAIAISRCRESASFVANLNASFQSGSCRLNASLLFAVSSGLHRNSGNHQCPNDASTQGPCVCHL